MLQSFKRFSAPNKYKFYVYFLIDPRNSNVFYIGKGKDKRIDNHEYEALRGVCSKKCNKIKSIISSGNKIIKHKIAGFDNEQDAYDYESICINYYGLKNLTNIVSGGAGGFERRHKESVKRYKAKIEKEQNIPTWKRLANKADMFVHWANITDFGKYKVISEGYETSVESTSKFAKFVERCHLVLYNELFPMLFNEVFSKKEDMDLFVSELKLKGVSVKYASA